LLVFIGLSVIAALPLVATALSFWFQAACCCVGADGLSLCMVSGSLVGF